MKSGFCGTVFFFHHIQPVNVIYFWYSFLLIWAVLYLYQLPGQMLKITYSLFKFMSYQPIFINIKLICNSDNKQEATSVQMLLQTFTDHFSSTSCEQPYEYDPFIDKVSTIVMKEGLDNNWWIKRFWIQMPLVFTGPSHFDMIGSCSCPYRVRYCSYSSASQ